MCYSLQSSTAKFSNLRKVMTQGSRWENLCAWRCFFFFFFFFFFAIWSRVFPSVLSPSIFFCLILRIWYAGPFEPRLIDVDGAALRWYNCKPNIFGSKIWPFFFSNFGSLSGPFLTCKRGRVHTIIFPHTTVLNGSRTGRLLVFISLWGSLKRFWKAIERKCATAVERMQILKKSRNSSFTLEHKKIKEITFLLWYYKRLFKIITTYTSGSTDG